MDPQALINTMNENGSRERSGYHLTYGALVKALKEAPKNARFDKRIKGIGSYRGYYIDIALFTGEQGITVEDEEFSGDYKDYSEWEKEHVTEVKKLPTNANELGKLLESLIGKDFVGYKGGNFTISEDKPLWLEETCGGCSGIAVTGVDNKLNLVTKEVKS